MTSIVTSLVVQFGSDSDASSVLTAEIDSREDGHNAGNTSFTPGQVVYYLISKTSDVTILSQETTAGRLTYVATESFTEKETLHFAKESSATVSNPISGGYTTKWLGNAPAANVTLTSEIEFSLKDSEGSLVEGLGVLQVEYERTVEVYSLSGLPSSLNGEDQYDVIIYITGESS